MSCQLALANACLRLAHFFAPAQLNRLIDEKAVTKAKDEMRNQRVIMCEHSFCMARFGLRKHHGSYWCALHYEQVTNEAN